MSKTDTDVIVSQYNAEFRAEPFSRPEWTIRGGLQHRITLPRRRSRTVAADFSRPGDGWSSPATVDVTKRFIMLYKGLALLGSTEVRALIVPDAPGSRFGVAVVLEQRQRA